MRSDEEGEGEPRRNESEKETQSQSEETKFGEFVEWTESELRTVANRRPLFLENGKEMPAVEGGEKGDADSEGDERLSEKGGSGKEGEEEVGEGFFEVPGDALGVVIDHDAREDGSEGGGEKDPLDGGVCKGEGFWEIAEKQRDRERGDQRKGEDFSGEPGGFEAEKEPPGFERLAEVEDGGDHADIEDDEAGPEGATEAETKPDLSEGEHQHEGPVGVLGGELGAGAGGGVLWD